MSAVPPNPGYGWSENTPSRYRGNKPRFIRVPIRVVNPGVDRYSYAITAVGEYRASFVIMDRVCDRAILTGFILRGKERGRPPTITRLAQTGETINIDHWPYITDVLERLTRVIPDIEWKKYHTPHDAV